jgi:hypothetical protein
VLLPDFDSWVLAVWGLSKPPDPRVQGAGRPPAQQLRGGVGWGWGVRTVFCGWPIPPTDVLNKTGAQERPRRTSHNAHTEVYN